MKSAYELAMERLGGTVQQFTLQQKEQLAEIDRQFEAKIAQARLDARTRLESCRNEPEKADQVQADLAVEIRSLETRRERRKEDLRHEFQRT